MRTLFALALGATVAHAQAVVVPHSPNHGAIVTNERGLSLPSGDFTVAEMADAVAGYLCRNYVYDPEVLAAAQGFTLQRAIALDALGAEEVLYALLAARELVALPLDETRGLFLIVSLRAAPNAAPPMAWVPWRTPAQLLNRPHLKELVMTAVSLQHVDAQAIANALRSQFALQQTWQAGAPTISAAGSRTLVLQGYGDQLAQTIQVLQQLDRSAAPLPSGDAAVLQRLQTLEREVEQLRRELRARR